MFPVNCVQHPAVMPRCFHRSAGYCGTGMIQKKVEHILVLDAQRKRFSRENEIVLRALLERLFCALPPSFGLLAVAARMVRLSL